MIDLKPLLGMCKGAGTTTALVKVLREREPNRSVLLVGQANCADRLMREHNLPNDAVWTVAEALRVGRRGTPAVLLCDTDALWELQAEIDRQAADAKRLQYQVDDLTAWQVAARQMALIRADEVADLSTCVGKLSEEKRELASRVQMLEADLDDVRNVRRNFKALEDELAAARQEAIEARSWRTMKDRDADRLADEVQVLVQRRKIDSRSPAGDALLDYREDSARRVEIGQRERQAKCVHQNYPINIAGGGVFGHCHSCGAAVWTHARMPLLDDIEGRQTLACMEIDRIKRRWPWYVRLSVRLLAWWEAARAQTPRSAA